MSHDEMLNALKHLQVETGSLVCLGCGYEHSCSIHGCAILRAAVDELERLKTLESAKSVTIQIKPCPIDEEVINFAVRRITNAKPEPEPAAGRPRCEEKHCCWRRDGTGLCVLPRCMKERT